LKKPFKGYWKYIFLLSLFLLAAGISIQILSGEWNAIAIGFTIGGAVFLGLWFIFQGDALLASSSPRSAEAGTNALLTTIAVIAIVGLINFVGVRYSEPIDLTESKRFTLAPQTERMLETLDQPVKVWLFSNQPQSDERELLENYQRIAPRTFQYEFVDPIQQPGIADRFGVEQQGEVYIEYNDQRQFVQNAQQGSLKEAKLTSRIAKLVGGQQSTVYFLLGHKEHSPNNQGDGGLSQAVKRLENSNITAETLNLAGGKEIPNNASAIAVVGPKQDFLESELDALRDYLNDGGSVFLAIDPQQEAGLSEFLSEWGVSRSDRVAVDPSQWVQGFGPVAPVVTDYGNHPITREFGQNYTFFVLASPLEVKAPEGINDTPLLLTGPKSWAEQNLNEGPDWEFNAEEDIRGPLVLGVALTKPLKESTAEASPTTEPSPTPSPEPSPQASPPASPTPSPEPSPQASPPASPSPNADKGETPAKESVPQARLVVLGDSDFATNGLISGNLNGDLFVNAMGWLSGQEEEFLSIQPSQPKNRRLNLNPQDVRLIGFMALLFPVLGFMASGLFWWFRR
jgi:ABC-type uncharacterized transport system involved in gliding motility auxiliary subunit